MSRYYPGQTQAVKANQCFNYGGYGHWAVACTDEDVRQARLSNMSENKRTTYELKLLKKGQKVNMREYGLLSMHKVLTTQISL